MNVWPLMYSEGPAPPAKRLAEIGPGADRLLYEAGRSNADVPSENLSWPSFQVGHYSALSRLIIVGQLAAGSVLCHA